jgi:hypothetical protein
MKLRQKRNLWLIGLVLVGVLSAACGDSNPTPPTPQDGAVDASHKDGGDGGRG